MKKDVIVRLVILVIALVNVALVVAGYNPIMVDDSAIYDGVSIAIATCSSLWCAWKNNPITEEAKAANVLMEELKANRGKYGGEQ